jgi:membrane associated rhomboid family serine protease
MSTRTKATLLTIGLAGAAFAVGPVIWPPSPDFPEPSSAQLPFFVGMAVAEAVVFGLGISFLLFGWRAARRASRRSRATVAVVCIAWLLVSWWPHIGLHVRSGHVRSGDDLWALLAIDYGFHLTLMVAAAVLAYLFVAEAREQRAIMPSATSGEAPPDRAEAGSAR